MSQQLLQDVRYGLRQLRRRAMRVDPVISLRSE